MILDKLLMFSEAQAVTATAASTDVIDLAPVDGTRRDIGVGYPLEFWALVNTTATAAGAATVNVQLQTSPDNSTWTTIYDSGALALAALKAGKRVVSAKVPHGRSALSACELLRSHKPADCWRVHLRYQPGR